ncbi:MAG: hypothetical protein IH945_05355 [Armatimonadetes bacterium]|nr:hypothetical protein [Armatimonadota bacterium]
MPNQYEQRSGTEGAQNYRPRKKIGLETPLVGRFWGEDKRLVFTPPTWYQLLVLGCFIFGTLAGLGGLFGWGWVPQMQIGVWLGPVVLLAGVWALLSMEYAMFDLKARTYFRREGRGLFKSSRRGSLADVDAVVLLCENYPYSVAGRIVIYRIVVHWKHAKDPLLVTERTQAAIPPGAPLNHCAQPMAVRAQRYAGALGVPFYDNSYFHSPAPQPPL